MKIKTSLEVDAKVWDEFRQIIRAKYGREKGFKTKVIEEAIALWIEKNKETIQDWLKKRE